MSIPFITNTGTILMTDFGWIQQTKKRSILPEIKLPIGEISISGILENPEEGLILGEQVISGNWPKVSQSRALETIAKEFSENLEPFLLVANFQTIIFFFSVMNEFEKQKKLNSNRYL